MAQMSFAPTALTVRLGQKKIQRLKRAQDIIELLAWSSVVIVTAMFLIDGGAANVNDWPSALDAISRLTALVGTDLLMIHMLLVARIPWIDEFYGHDKATIAHKKLGKPVLYFVVAHFLASLISFSLTEGKNLVATWWWFITDVEDMLTATLGLLLMILVVITSLNFARRKMSYEAWFFVHLLSYASVLLAVPHIFTSGSDVAGKPVQTMYWAALYLFVACNIIWYRALKPWASSLSKGLKVSQVVRESEDTISIYVTGKNIMRLGAQAGQFFLVRPLAKSQWYKAHPFSISATPVDQYLRFTIAIRGDDSAWLQVIEPGTRLILEGPYGVFTEERRTREKVVLMASGIGVTPVRALAESLVARPGDITVIYRVRNEADANLIDELRELCRIRDHKFAVIAGHRGPNGSWMNADPLARSDQERLLEIAPNLADSDVFICGPEVWTRQAVKTVALAGTPAKQIHSEEFAW
jgi:hypothetical protein